MQYVKWTGTMSDDQKKKNYTFDAEITGTVEMPTLSTLLNLKKAPDRKAAPATPASHRPSSPGEMTQTDTQTSREGTAPKIQASRRPRGGTQSGLVQLDLRRIELIHAGLAHGLEKLSQVGECSALYFMFTTGPNAQKQPLKGAATFGPAVQRELWNGAIWNTALTPFIWQRVIRQGFYEFPREAGPGGEVELLRLAFGLRENEHIVFARVGPLDRCKGAVLIISPTRPTHLDEVLPFIAEPSAARRKAA